MHIVYPDRENISQMLKEADDSSCNFIVVVTAALNPASTDSLKACLDECVRALKHGGLLFVQGRPDYLP